MSLHDTSEPANALKSSHFSKKIFWQKSHVRNDLKPAKDSKERVSEYAIGTGGRMLAVALLWGCCIHMIYRVNDYDTRQRAPFLFLFQ